MEPLILGRALCKELCFSCSIHPTHQSFMREETGPEAGSDLLAVTLTERLTQARFKLRSDPKIQEMQYIEVPTPQQR